MNNNKEILIYEHDDYTSFTVPVKFTFRTAKMSVQKQREFLVESIRVNISVIADHLEGLGADLLADNVKGIHTGAIIEILGAIIVGFCEALEIVESEFNDNPSETSEGAK